MYCIIKTLNYDIPPLLIWFFNKKQTDPFLHQQLESVNNLSKKPLSLLNETIKTRHKEGD